MNSRQRMATRQKERFTELRDMYLEMDYDVMRNNERMDHEQQEALHAVRTDRSLDACVMFIASLLLPRKTPTELNREEPGEPRQGSQQPDISGPDATPMRQPGGQEQEKEREKANDEEMVEPVIKNSLLPNNFIPRVWIGPNVRLGYLSWPMGNRYTLQLNTDIKSPTVVVLGLASLTSPSFAPLN
ncbi:hypothetical protein PoMZ_09426 [Pyricularia oryzae]|uniref:Uncharacterized protein n=1 Tax=Pyricularia oryzae TaxID=318829 RepID=A0A4P7MU49_PYROR|nr:hypothetical protein PoMZ_09426 [Pyricularia oryzae]